MIITTTNKKEKKLKNRTGLKIRANAPGGQSRTNDDFHRTRNLVTEIPQLYGILEWGKYDYSV